MQAKLVKKIKTKAFNQIDGLCKGGRLKDEQVFQELLFKEYNLNVVRYTITISGIKLCTFSVMYIQLKEIPVFSAEGSSYVNLFIILCVFSMSSSYVYIDSKN